jgi:hypothetical protein
MANDAMRYFALIVLCATQMFAANVPCNAKNAPSGWKTFIDRVHRFCFQYPPQYSRFQNLEPTRNSIVSLRSKGDIEVWIDDLPFGPQRLEELSRSGNPPVEQKMNGLTFYYNGPGGGGVDYSDDFLFNLRGKILHIEFVGPYIDDNHPSENTKELEPELLKTFRTF